MLQNAFFASQMTIDEISAGKSIKFSMSSRMLSFLAPKKKEKGPIASKCPLLRNAILDNEAAEA